MRLPNELKYGLSKLSSLGSYPFHLLLIIILYKIEMPQNALFLLLGFVLVYLFGIPLRILLFPKRKRPKYQEIFLQKYRASSFPSFHSARITFLGIFFSHFFNFETDILVISGALIVLVSMARVVNRQHFPSDTIGGIMFGIIVWIISYLIVGVK